MTEKTRALLEQVLRLPPGERLDLAYEILESVEGGETEFSREQIAEIERRARAALAGTSPAGDEWEVVLARLERRLAEPGA
jgi:putative addiction module component (TIGR02574 family)